MRTMALTDHALHVAYVIEQSRVVINLLSMGRVSLAAQTLAAVCMQRPVESEDVKARVYKTLSDPDLTEFRDLVDCILE